MRTLRQRLLEELVYFPPDSKRLQKTIQAFGFNPDPTSTPLLPGLQTFLQRVLWTREVPLEKKQGLVAELAKSATEWVKPHDQWYGLKASLVTGNVEFSKHNFMGQLVTAILENWWRMAKCANPDCPAFAGLRVREIEALHWEDYRDGEIHVSRSRWNGHETEPKTKKSRAPVPVIRHLAERIEMHRLRCGNPETGPMFRTRKCTPLMMKNLLGREIIPSLKHCEVCHKAERAHGKADHDFKRDEQLQWHGWHAARRGLGSNLNRLGVDDSVIQRILRHSNLATTQTYYIKTVSDDVRGAMTKL